MNKFLTVFRVLSYIGVFSVLSISCSRVALDSPETNPQSSSSTASNVKGMRGNVNDRLGSSGTNPQSMSSSNVKVIPRTSPTTFAGSYQIINDGLASIGITTLDLIKSGFNKEEKYTDSDGKSYRIRGDLKANKDSNGKTTLKGSLAVFNGVAEVLLDFQNLVVESKNNTQTIPSGHVRISAYDNSVAQYSLKDIVDFKHDNLDSKLTYQNNGSFTAKSNGNNSLSCPSGMDGSKCQNLVKTQTARVSANSCSHLLTFFK